MQQLPNFDTEFSKERQDAEAEGEVSELIHPFTSTCSFANASLVSGHISTSSSLLCRCCAMLALLMLLTRKVM